MATPTNTAIIYGKVSSYLASVDIANQKGYMGGVVNRKLPIQILLATKTIEWIYGLNPADISLPKVVAYQMALCGKYIQMAQGLQGNVGIINPVTRVASSIAALGYAPFTIGTGTNPIDPTTTLPITTGGLKFIIPYGSILVDSIGITYNNTPLPPKNMADRVSFTAAYTQDYVTVTLNQGVTIGDLFVITGLQYVTV